MQSWSYKRKDASAGQNADKIHQDVVELGGGTGQAGSVFSWGRGTCLRYIK